jgi:hypothetical protein
MARIVLTNAFISVGGVDLSDLVASVTLNSTFDVVETTAFAAGNVPSAAKTRIAGLVDNSVTLEFHQDYATGEVEQTIYPLLGTAAAVIVKPNGASTSAFNPSYTCSAIIAEWTPINGSVGELATASVTWPVTGAITKAVA